MAQDALVDITVTDGVAEVALNRPDRRNALSIELFEALETRIDELSGSDELVAILLRGHGRAFCAGFDLADAVDDPATMASYIDRLSAVTRKLRRAPQIVVAAAHGAALAGGCALLAGCDFIFVASDTRLGYPVHRLGVSPAVTIPTLRRVVGDGASRELLLSGRVIDGVEAARLGLAFRLAPDEERLIDQARAFVAELAGKGRNALRVTKRWLNELDGLLSDRAMDDAAAASRSVIHSDEAIFRLREFWASRDR